MWNAFRPRLGSSRAILLILCPINELRFSGLYARVLTAGWLSPVRFCDVLSSAREENCPRISETRWAILTGGGILMIDCLKAMAERDGRVIGFDCWYRPTKICGGRLGPPATYRHR